jgi:hypothetical protein
MFLLLSWELRNCERRSDCERDKKAFVDSRFVNSEILRSAPNVGEWSTSRTERFTALPPFRQTTTVPNNWETDCVVMNFWDIENLFPLQGNVPIIVLNQSGRMGWERKTA